MNTHAGEPISNASVLALGATLVAGSLRSFPQDSWSLIQFRQVKRMIRGSGDETSFTYSQTLNRRDA